MKKLLFVIVLAVITSGVFAQAKKTKSQPSPKAAVAKKDAQPASKIYYTYQDGKVIKNNGDAKEAAQGDQITFPNGNVLLREGTFVFNNGTEKISLGESQIIDANGDLKSLRDMMDSASPHDQK